MSYLTKDYIISSDNLQTGWDIFLEQAREQTSLYQLLFDHARDIILIVQPDGKIIEANDSALKAYGYNRKEFLAMHIQDLREPTSRPLISSQMEEAEKKGILFETMHRRKDGSFFYVEVSSKGALLGKKRILLSIIRDISRRKQAEEKLLSTHKQLLDILEFLPDATFVVDSERNVIAWNKAMEELTKVPKEEIIGKGTYAYAVPLYGKPKPILIDLIFSSDPETENNYEYIERKENTLFAEIFVPNLHEGSGGFLWLKASPLHDSQGNLVGAIESIRDITESKLMEKKLRKRHNHLEDLVYRRNRQLLAANEHIRVITDALPVLISYVDSEHRYRFNNKAYEDWFGQSRETLYGMHLRDVDNKSYQVIRKYVEAALAGKRISYECSIPYQDGRKRHVSATYVPHFTDDGEVAGFFALVSDVTDKEEMKKEMARLDQLNMVGQMAAGIGHEIRNPMTAIRGLLQILMGKSQCREFIEYFSLMINELDRANSIITEFLSLARNRPSELKKQNLNTIVLALGPLITADAMNSGNYIKIETGDLPDLDLNEKEIRQLILNLTRNGLEAMPSGGCLTIRTFIDHKYVVLSVQDQGKGIPSDIFEKVGTPFLTTKIDGTGLGLATSYSIAARHNATVKIDTGPLGTTFSVLFENCGNKECYKKN